MNIQDAVNTYLENIKADYADFQALSMRMAKRRNQDTERLAIIHERSFADFEKGLAFKVGKKYIKVTKDGSVHSFIVNIDNDPQFPYGTILKAASYAAPARNFSRGDIFGDYNVSWTGA